MTKSSRKLSNYQWLMAAVVGVALISGCDPSATSSDAPSSFSSGDSTSEAGAIQWRPVFQGVSMCAVAVDTPRPMRIHAARVDLQAPGVKLLVTPSNGDEPEDCGARTTSEFLLEFGCQVAINGSAFKLPHAKHQGDPLDVLGLSLSQGDLYSPPNKFDALLIDEAGKAWVDESPIQPKNAFNGLSGFYVLLTDGQNRGTDKSIHPRSAVGVSKDGGRLILMVIDGRQKGYSEGATTAETAAWIHRLGAWNALNLDGGGSSTLVVQAADGAAEVVNKPSGITERRVANHLGVFANQPVSH